MISKGWYAGAGIVDVRVDTNLSASNATMAVLDNGSSMNLAGLRELWHIAFSPKEGTTTEHGRPLIGKFGIGKLATYVLGERLTYICRADDGVIRRVTMDYGDVDTQKETESDRLINDLELDVFELGREDLAEALSAVYDGDAILRLIDQQTRNGQEEEHIEDLAPIADHEEFGGAPAELERPERGTWTLVVLSHLKPAGRRLKTAILRRMLASALPFGSDAQRGVGGSSYTAGDSRFV